MPSKLTRAPRDSFIYDVTASSSVLFCAVHLFFLDLVLFVLAARGVTERDASHVRNSDDFKHNNKKIQWNWTHLLKIFAAQKRQA